MGQTDYSLGLLLGVEIGALIPMLSPNCIWVTLRGVDAGGIWIECEQLTASFCSGRQNLGEVEEKFKMVGFFPFAQINYLVITETKPLYGPAQILSFTKTPGGTGNADEKEQS